MQRSDSICSSCRLGAQHVDSADAAARHGPHAAARMQQQWAEGHRIVRTIQEGGGRSQHLHKQHEDAVDDIGA